MSGQKPPLSPLELRKRLLIAESEINRAQLLQEWETMTEGIHGLADRAKTIGSYASVVAALVAGLVAFGRTKGTPAPEKPSRIRSILKVLRLAVSVWLAFRARRHDDVDPRSDV
jgi:hypothetical protein